jgi:hypothetical protein
MRSADPGYRFLRMPPGNATAAGQAALVGWRAKVADGVAEPISRRAPFSDEQVRALLGGLFFALSLLYVIGTIRRVLAQ